MSQKEVDSQLKSARDSLDRLENIVNSTIDQINSQNNLTPIQPIKPLYLTSCKVRDCENSSWYGSHYIRFDVPKECIKILNKKFSNVRGDESWGYYQFSYNTEKSKENYTIILNAIEELDSETDKENIIASQINIHTKEVVMKMLHDIGIPTSKYEYKTSRSRNKESITCAWTYEIQSAFNTYSSNVTSTKNKLIETFDKIYKVDQDKRKEEQNKKQQEIERKENERLLAFMLSKHELDITSDWEDLQSAIIDKNKYLYLAHYLMKNRGDWNDGYSYAETGLSGFIIETAQDQEISDCISDIITTHDDVDGRYFRDCSWSYDALYGIVKEQNSMLYEDYLKVREHVEDY
ncbi:MAG: hypothetical protein K0S41_4373 [Anaerocolumna sp.]|jgi:hypothetical protein|nr:hypothetical protein [Anaerocolumna sp.]